MRTSALQYLYLQKPISSVILICAIALLPWLSNEFYTQNERHETKIASSVLTSGYRPAPKIDTGELTYKAPLAYWFMAAFSLPQGEVSAFSARLPSAIAQIVLLGFVLAFFGKRIRFQEAFIATLLLLTGLGMHRAGLTAGTDMLFTTFIALGMMQLYRWENKLELKGLPLEIPLLFSAAVLTKGLAGIIYPMLIFGCYLFLLHKHSPLKIAKSLFYVGLTALFIPSIWYIEGWRQGGSAFLQMALGEDFRHLVYPAGFCLFSEKISSLLSPIVGFLPWTILLFCSLFGLSRRDFLSNHLIEKDREEVNTRKKTRLFCSITAIGLFVLTFISGETAASGYLPAYPFIAIFMAQYFIYLTENRSYVTRIFAGIMAVITLIVVTLCTLTLTSVDLTGILSTSMPENTETIKRITNAISLQNTAFVIPFIFVLIALATTCYQLLKKINIKILYASIFLIFCLQLLIDGIGLYTSLSA